MLHCFLNYELFNISQESAFFYKLVLNSGANKPFTQVTFELNRCVVI